MTKSVLKLANISIHSIKGISCFKHKQVQINTTKESALF